MQLSPFRNEARKLINFPKRITPEADQITTQTFAVAVQASNLYRWVTANIR